jgi:hypothetical protein
MFRIKGLSLDMTPGDVTEAAPKINRDAKIPEGAKVGFWPRDSSAEPVATVPNDATGVWYYGYSVPPTAPPPKSLTNAPDGSIEQVFGDAMVDALKPGQRDASLWQRRGWAVVKFDADHRTDLVALKIRRHFGPAGPMAIPENDLKPAELAQRMIDSYGFPDLQPNDANTGWEHADRGRGCKIEFCVMHWTSRSAGAGIKDEFLSWHDERLEEFEADVVKARSMAGLAGMMGDGGPTALAGMANKLDTAWVLSLLRTTKAAEVKFD